MKLSHKLGKETLSKIGSANLLLSNPKGFLLFDSSTKYGGLFVEIKGEMYKILEGIEIKGKVSEQINCFDSVKIRRGSLEEYSFDKNALLFKSSSKKKIKLIFDIRKIYDLSDDEQHYSVKVDKKKIKVHFEKRKEFSVDVIISGLENFEVVDKWEERAYEKDLKRNSLPAKRWVYVALSGEAKNLKIQVEGIEKSIQVKEKDLVFAAAKSSLLNLTHEGIRAGWPWFYQYWSRDELISLKGLLLCGEKKKVKERLLLFVDSINEKGRLPNILPNNGLGSADSIGWLFVRIRENLNLFSEKELRHIGKKLQYAIDSQISLYHKNGFFVNQALETWMDTDYKGDVRAGARIEIQALMLNMFHLAFDLSGDVTYLRLEESLANNVKRFFFKHGSLCDGLNDATLRPNIFLAYYVYPSLLTKKEWQSAFDSAILALWLPFGGLASIDKKNSLFQKEYSGENNKSYHRGDSWYFLNNLAGVCMLDLNKKKFGKYVRKIYSASKKDLLFMGAMGHFSEVSSAGKQSADGCLSQAWSAATFIELGKMMEKF